MGHFEDLRNIFPYLDIAVIEGIIKLVRTEVPDNDRVSQLERMVTLLMDHPKAGNHYVHLKEIFPFVDRGIIEDIIELVKSEIADDSEVLQLERMVTLLTGASNKNTLMVNDRHKNLFVKNIDMELVVVDGDKDSDCSDDLYAFHTDESPESFTNTEDDDSDGEAECIERQQLKAQLLQRFPNIPRKHINDLLTDDKLTFEEAVLNLSLDGYPLISYSGDDMLKTLQMISPNVSNNQLQTYIKNGLTVSKITEKYFNKQRMEVESHFSNHWKNLKHLFDFKIDAFLTEYPHLVEEFHTSRVHSLVTDSNSIEIEKDRCFAGVILCNVYKHLKQSEVVKSFKSSGFDIITTCKELGIIKQRILIEKEWLLPENSYVNFLMFQELVYGLYQFLINSYKRIQGQSLKCADQSRKDNNLAQTCSLCHKQIFVLAKGNGYQCTKGCLFCQTCMQQSCVDNHDRSSNLINCFLDCDGHFQDISFEMVMDDNEFQRSQRREQMKQAVNSTAYFTMN